MRGGLFVKKFMQKNKVAMLLIAVLAICVVVIIVFSLKYFYFGNGNSKYGDRLDGIEDVKIEEVRLSELEAKAETDEFIKDCTITVSGKILYIMLDFKETATLTEAETKALAFLENFSEEENGFYEFQFTLTQASTEENTGFIISGAKNVNGTNLVWNNQNAAIKEEESSNEE